MVKSYILIRFLAGFEASALSQVRVTPGISEVNLVFGHWDAIAVAEAKNLYELSRLVISQIRGIQGVEDTETLVYAQI
ncbi:MAG: Lrp/AsnC family transcriptional regulator [Chloroflexi bacterium]|nr:Lrp/AsnC family transcriptional regulator [Chloroflexota bacterium]